METTSNFADGVRTAIHAWADEVAGLVEEDPQFSNALQAKFLEWTAAANKRSSRPVEDQAKDDDLRRLLVAALIDLLVIGQDQIDEDLNTTITFGGISPVDVREKLTARIRATVSLPQIRGSSE
jgi:hypothetical protein